MRLGKEREKQPVLKKETSLSLARRKKKRKKVKSSGNHSSKENSSEKRDLAKKLYLFLPFPYREAAERAPLARACTDTLPLFSLVLSSKRERKIQWRPALLLLLPAAASPHLRRRLRRQRPRLESPHRGALLSLLAPWRCRRASLDLSPPEKRTLLPFSRRNRAAKESLPPSSMRRPPPRQASPPPPLARSLAAGTGRCVLFLLSRLDACSSPLVLWGMLGCN